MPATKRLEPSSRGVSRRAFLRGAGAGTGVTVLGAGVGVAVLSGRATAAAWMWPDETVESPSSHEMATLGSIADTFIPSSDGGGGKEAGAATILADPFYELNPFISEMVSDIDDASSLLFWEGDFYNNSLSSRTQIMEERLGYAWWSPGSLYKDAYLGALALTKLAFFGGLVNTVGTSYIGFPGPSAGYAPGGGGGLPPEQSCAGDCGGYGGACWCDSLCATYGDCCADYAEMCL